MSELKTKCRIVEVTEGTPGGITYVIKLPNERGDGSARCFRQIRSDPTKRCTNVAGFKTDHVGTGACRFHGGLNTSNVQIVSGKYAKMTRLRLNDKIDDYLNQDRSELLDLTYHLAATRAIFDEFVDGFPDTESEDYGIWFHRFTTIIGTLGTLVEKITKVDNRNSLTAAQVMYIRATMVDLIMKYIDDPASREQFVKELAVRMGGDVEVTMRPSEVLLPK